MEIYNKVDYNIVYSNLSHPDLVSPERKFRKVVRIDKSFSKKWLINEFHRCDMTIGNFYVIIVHGRYWYRENKCIYLLEKI